MKKKLLKYVLIFLVFQNAQSQTLLFHEEVDSVYQKSKFGLNATHYIHPFISFGLVFGENNEGNTKTKFGASNQLGFGLRYKLRMNNFMAIGVDAQYQLLTVSYPTQKPILKEKYSIQDLNFSGVLRFNFGMRGDIIGKFLDIGAYISMPIQSKHKIKTETASSSFRTLSYQEEQLNYIEPFQYGFLARFGINQFLVFAEYRYSRSLKLNAINQFKNVPAWSIGLQIGLHR